MNAEILLRVENVPVYQNRMFESAAEATACARGDVVLGQDARSGLVHNLVFDAAKVVYDTDYQNEQGHSAGFRRHLSEALAVVTRHAQAAEVLEVGCGKGTFVAMMREAGLHARGIDPAYEGDAPYIARRLFVPGSDRPAALVVLRHVLEHVSDPWTFLAGIRDANQGGLVYIEVPCFDWILARRAWFDVFYEHVNYFREQDFRRSFGRVFEVTRLFSGQYLGVVADLGSLRDPGDAALGAPPQVVLPDGFFATLDRCAALCKDSTRSACWGGAAKGVMFAHHLALRGARLDCAIDINPAKQGRFLAGSGLAVRSPADALAQLGPAPTLFVMNSNYLSEIRDAAGDGPRYVTVDAP